MIISIIKLLMILIIPIMLTSCEQGWMLSSDDDDEVQLEIKAETNTTITLRRDTHNGEIIFSDYFSDGELQIIIIEPGDYFIDDTNDDKLCDFRSDNETLTVYYSGTYCY